MNELPQLTGHVVVNNDEPLTCHISMLCHVGLLQNLHQHYVLYVCVLFLLMVLVVDGGGVMSCSQPLKLKAADSLLLHRAALHMQC